MKLKPLFTTTLSLAGALTLSAAAFAQDTTAPSPPAPEAATQPEKKPAAASAKWTEAEKTFAMKAAGGNLTEVKLGELASTKGTSEDVKTFGQQMVTDHGKANTDLEAVLTEKGMSFAPKLNAKQQAGFDKMSKLEGAAFDKAYTADMLKDHIADVAEYKEAVKTTKDEDLKNYQTTTLPVLEHHLMMVKDMSKKMGASKKE